MRVKFLADYGHCVGPMENEPLYLKGEVMDLRDDFAVELIQAEVAEIYWLSEKLSTE